MTHRFRERPRERFRESAGMANTPMVLWRNAALRRRVCWARVEEMDGIKNKPRWWEMQNDEDTGEAELCRYLGRILGSACG